MDTSLFKFVLIEAYDVDVCFKQTISATAVFF